MLFCAVDAVSAFWQNHSSVFPSLSALQAGMTDFRRRLASRSSSDMDATSAAAAAEQRDSSSAGSDDVK